MKTRASRAFTLIETILAIGAAAILLAALYGLFSKVIKLRDKATNHLRDAMVQARAVSVLRNDLLNGRIVSSAMRGGIVGMETPPNGTAFKGYLRFTTTTGRDTDEAPYGDTQEVEYYIDSDAQSDNTEAGVLVRTIDHVLLADNPAIQTEERLLTGIQALELEFYDGTDWQTSWDSATSTTNDTSSSSATTGSSSTSASATASTPPKAVRVRIVPWVARGESPRPPIEVTVPWGTVTQ